ncbi:MAG: NUDIX domain-containing protein [Rubrobacter sp.]|nr:NUDIX domain-containing protein [Rubrobacter sp.]
MEEELDILDSTGAATGESAPKSEVHRLGLYHRCFHCWISGTGSGGPYLLVQRRARGKENWPGMLDATAAGHLQSGEETLDGLREVEEELGLRVEPRHLIRLGTREIDQEIPAGRDREFQEVFLLLETVDPSAFRLQREEVLSVARLDLDAVERLHGGEAVTAEEWSAAGERREAEVGLGDFVPNDDRYLLRVARAVRAARAGGAAAESFREPPTPGPPGTR